MMVICRDFRKVLRCIQRHIEKTCGQEAAGLVPVLVKPMVRRSNLCDLSHDDARDLVRHFISIYSAYSAEF